MPGKRLSKWSQENLSLLVKQQGHKSSTHFTPDCVKTQDAPMTNWNYAPALWQTPKFSWYRKIETFWKPDSGGWDSPSGTSLVGRELPSIGKLWSQSLAPHKSSLQSQHSRGGGKTWRSSLAIYQVSMRLGNLRSYPQNKTKSSQTNQKPNANLLSGNA